MIPGKPAPVLTVLGSGTALPSAERHSPAHHLDLARASVLVDCGPGTLHGLDRHGIDWAGLTHVVVSHFHNDHVGDLAAIPFAMRLSAAPERTIPLTLVGPPGLAGFLERLAAALGRHVLEPGGFPVLVREVPLDEPFVDPGGEFRVRAYPTPHTGESVALRVEGAWGAVGYTGDTGPSTEVAAFLRGCQVVISECSLSDPPDMDRHLSPRLVAQLGAVSAPDLLVLTHVYPPLTPERAVEQVSRLYHGRVVAGRDGMRIVLGADGPAVDPNADAI